MKTFFRNLVLMLFVQEILAKKFTRDKKASLVLSKLDYAEEINKILLDDPILDSREGLAASENLCFDGVCFSSFMHLGKKGIPKDPKTADVEFLLYTSKHKDMPTQLSYNNLTLLKESDFNAKAETKFLVHGFLNKCGSDYIQNLKNSLLSSDPSLNVFCVEWKNLAEVYDYAQAATDTQVVAALMVYFLEMINKEYVNINKKTHMIGFSLGAQICGMAAKNLTGLKRISGLDPAGPIFNYLDTDKRLDETDADFVDVIHTNGEKSLGFGYFERAGHVDFYPNGGKHQAGCSSWFNPFKVACHHSRAPLYYIESFDLSCQLIGFQCDSYENFMKGLCFAPTKLGAPQGYYADKSLVNGSLYLITRKEPPFCGNQYLVEVKIDLPSEKITSLKSDLYLIFYSPGGIPEKVPIFRNKPESDMIKLPIITKLESKLEHLSILYEANKASSSLPSINVSYVTLTTVRGDLCRYIVNGSILYSGMLVELVHNYSIF